MGYPSNNPPKTDIVIDNFKCKFYIIWLYLFIYSYKKENGLIVIDIDRNQINIPESVEIVEFPIEFVQSLKSKISEMDLHIVQTKKLSRYIYMYSITV